MAAVALAVAGPAASTKTGRKRAIARAVKEVAHHLGNTPAVARRSYIDPRVIDFYEQGTTIDPTIVLEHQGGTGIRDALEAAVVDLLEGAHRITRRHTARAS